MKTISYSQPEFYHFSEDSIELAKFASQFWAKEKKLHLVDMFAGCGVVGIEFFFRHQDTVQLTFIEAEEQYLSHLEENTQSARINMISHFSIEDISTIETVPEDAYIIANPPYFSINTGREPSDIKRRRANFIRIENWRRWLDLVANHQVLFLGREDSNLISCDCRIKKLKSLNNKTGIFTLDRNS
ncbi:MAG: hypothetical protein CME65_01540 [Halobacteriovoraceae bacterium]|nr:hypothetical protein [Halobacteriovoraceae bacterium]|tara:strand:- start:11448 stop:12005 length:558 start_codon:yes stop_codon:yes gene_type:complete